jgi:hypothetical protein
MFNLLTDRRGKKMTTHLTEHFTLEEMIFSQTATRQGINNTSSAHCLGYAADIVPVQGTKSELAKWISHNCPFDQIIMEFGERTNPNWVHVSCDARHRKQVLYAHGSPVAYTPITL